MTGAAAIIPAAGSGSRMQLDRPKQFLDLAGVPILIHTVRAFVLHPDIHRIVVVVPPSWLAETRQLCIRHGLDKARLTITAGGRRRQDSVLAGLRQLDESSEIVLVHDGARPLVSRLLIDRCLQAARQHGAAIAAIPVKDTLKKADADQMVAATIDRHQLWQAQTPQAARRTLLLQAFAELGDTDVTDESSLLEQAGIPVALVEGAESNFKITRPEDLFLAEKLMTPSSPPAFRIGHGFDAHRLVADRPLILGGVNLPYHLGLAGHSDADVLTHALCDALLGATGAGDIGRHFPDTAAAYAGIYSIRLLEQVVTLVGDKGYQIGNIDITLVCQAPKIAPHLAAMTAILATACRISPEAINIKATTTEKMGYTGRGEGISCHAVALLHSFAK